MSSEAKKWRHPGGKLRELGAGSLSESELLAILIPTGTKGRSAEAIACDLIERFGSLDGLANQPLESLLAVEVLGDETLKTIARELVDTFLKNTTIDWTVKQSVRAKLRTMVTRILRKYGCPPEKQERATQTVLEQAELLCKDWAS